MNLVFVLAALVYGQEFDLEKQLSKFNAKPKLKKVIRQQYTQLENAYKAQSQKMYVRVDNKKIMCVLVEDGSKFIDGKCELGLLGKLGLRDYHREFEKFQQMYQKLKIMKQFITKPSI